jgi:hypothetical protein
MNTYRFKAGQTVKITTERFGSKVQGAFQIVRSLPVERDGAVTYRIKSSLDGHERVVSEGDIS